MPKLDSRRFYFYTARQYLQSLEIPKRISYVLRGIKSQCRKILRISNQFQKFQFCLIPPKHPFRGTISRNDIKKSPSALHFKNFRKVRKFAKNTFFNSGNGCKFQQISTKQYKRAKAPIDLILLMYLADIHSFKTP